MDRQEILRHIIVKRGDITRESTDAIVNAANPGLLGGGGVDGAIHRAAGPELLTECKTLGGCNHGEARITKGYNLKARWVIHTPGPIYRDGHSGEAAVLQRSYANCMRLAKERGLRSIAFPAISAGVYGYPKDAAASIAVSTVIDFMAREQYLVDVYFVLYDDVNYNIYNEIMKGLGAS